LEEFHGSFNGTVLRVVWTQKMHEDSQENQKSGRDSNTVPPEWKHRSLLVYQPV